MIDDWGAAAAGLIAVTGGLEVASDRLLTLMDKGITIEQAARSAWAFRQAGVRVHAYLMYGFPTETAQETVDSLEIVRQLFAAGLLDSWIEPSDAGPPRRYYRITANGRLVLDQWVASWRSTRQTVDRVLEGEEQ
jgi:hypothetical protein